jgi:osmotically-inducible protein OsmY
VRNLVYAGDPGPVLSQSQIATRIKSRPGFQALGPIEVLLDQRTIILRGTVATAHDRELAARLALLEGGVDNVSNELTVAPPLAR